MIGIALLTIVFSFIKAQDHTTNNIENLNKEYQAGVGKVIVLGTQDKKEITAIDLSAKEGDFVVEFTPHNVAMADDKTALWVTASASQEQIQAMSKELVEKTKRDQHVMMATDQVISINTVTDKITKRVPIGVSLNLSDLILTQDGKNVYVTAERVNAIYRIDTSNYKVHLIQLPPESKPHQLALSADGTKLYVRSQTNNNVLLISTRANEVKNQADTEELKNLKWSGH
jgi:DNA-binding beta-propeller fold protein YncE